MENFYLVSSGILPDVIEKVIETQNLLSSGKVRKISEAVRITGISRGTFYKYKDQVFALPNSDATRKAVITLIVRDEKGILSRILSRIVELNASVLAINQTIPLQKISNISLTLDITELSESMESAMAGLKELEGVEKAELVAVE